METKGFTVQVLISHQQVANQRGLDELVVILFLLLLPVLVELVDLNGHIPLLC